MKLARLVVAVSVLSAVPTLAQQRPPDLTGTWRAETADGPQTIVVRGDSSASFGDETVRWRLVADSIFVALGDEWLVYNYELRRRTLTLSGGDLVDPIALRRIGPPTPLPAGVSVPPPPPMSRRAETPPESE
ncbi:MAG TPA: hypothetical protein VGA37_15085 [Gemmatimonadales bacterium]